ncbi:hypothetical protein CIPAW_09G096400 [Carya illinoinensis]|uniref:Uncharacterized protein n=1 Tax=Carya illinoinensis TaxID=32201 RepID=A0A8T1PC76_CARIL|nr:hypothetical protein CIPAW_09G096400 [Carya illinoinensis]
MEGNFIFQKLCDFGFGGEEKLLRFWVWKIEEIAAAAVVFESGRALRHHLRVGCYGEGEEKGRIHGNANARPNRMQGC